MWLEQWAMLQVVGIWLGLAACAFGVLLACFILVRDSLFMRCDDCGKWTLRRDIVEGIRIQRDTVWLCKVCARKSIR